MPKKITQEELLDREAQILRSACEIIEQCGFSNLTMDKVVDAVPYSKGSVYKLFNSIEEILLAITNDGGSVLLEFMQRALTYQGGSRKKTLSRERNLARAYAYHLYGQLYPTHFFCELQAISPIVREKASTKRLLHGKRLLDQFKTLSSRFITDAIDCGDLQCPSNNSTARIANCSWSAEFGVTSYALAASDDQRNIGTAIRLQLEQDIFCLANTYMDGLNWQPLSTNEDYQKVWEEIKVGLFSEEIKRFEKQ